MTLLTSPFALGGFAVAAIVVFNLYSRSVIRERYAALGAGPPTAIRSKTFGLNIIVAIFKGIRKHRFYHWTQEVLEEYNHTTEVNILGTTLVMTDDPENLKALQDTQFRDVAKSEEQHEIFKHILGDAIFAMNGEEWKQEVALYKPHMSRIRESDFPITERHLLNAFDLLAQDGNEAFDVIDRYQLDVVTEVFCGESTNSLTSNQQPFRNAMDTLLKIASFRWSTGKFGALLDDKWIAPKEVKFIDDFQDAFAAKAFARAGQIKESGQLCLIDDLILKGKDRAAIKNAATSVLLAGKDPGVTTMSWAFYEIARHPAVFARMKAEVEEHVGLDKLPVLSDLHKLKYIRMVIKETLREHHPLGFNTRVATKDIALPRGGGPDGKSPSVVLKGTIILYGLLSLQHRKDLGIDDVEVWRPERWETWKPNNQWDYIPFNHGPRICIGQVFANFQMEYFFARLAQEFESITLLPHSLPQEGLVKFELNTKLAHPIYAKAVRRARA